jgi:DNA-nicking Smr family endonuclease
LDLFLREMADVTPLGETAPQRVPRPSPDPSMFKSDPSSDEDREVLRYLNDLLAGNVDFDIKYTDEYQEGHVKGLPPLTVQKLRDGLFPVQDHLDLHGLSLSESQIAIHKFVTQAAALRKRSLLIIHGRGLRSPDGIPVLKINLGNLLLRSPVKRHILAFATALPVDGGPGSSYVLLRRHPPALNRGQ